MLEELKHWQAVTVIAGGLALVLALSYKILFKSNKMADESDEIIATVVKMEEISEQDDKELAGAKKEIRNSRTVIIPENPFPDTEVDAYPPLKYSWVIPKKLAAMALPRHKENLQFLLNEGITHLITLSAGKKPPLSECSQLRWTEIPVEEFELPSLDQVVQFVCVCKNADVNGEVLGVHCRQGRSRCSVMLACYLVHFHRLLPDQAIRVVKAMRSGSLETPEHEGVVQQYYQHIQKDNPVKFGASPEQIDQLLDAVKVQDTIL